MKEMPPQSKFFHFQFSQQKSLQIIGFPQSEELAHPPPHLENRESATGNVSNSHEQFLTISVGIKIPNFTVYG